MLISYRRRSGEPRASSVLLALLGVFFILSAPSHADDTSVPAPVVKVGDAWRWQQTGTGIFSKTTELRRTITGVSTSQIEAMQNDRKILLTPELNVIESEAIKASTAGRFLAFPMEVGRKWSVRHIFESRLTGNRRRWELEAEVVTRERLTVPAGEFDTLKIEFKGWSHNESSPGKANRLHLVYWYSPAVREAVKRDYDDGSQTNSVQLVSTNFQP